LYTYHGSVQLAVVLIVVLHKLKVVVPLVWHFEGLVHNVEIIIEKPSPMGGDVRAEQK
jgi:hypothetical protein